MYHTRAELGFVQLSVRAFAEDRYDWIKCRLIPNFVQKLVGANANLGRLSLCGRRRYYSIHTQSHAVLQ